MNFYKIIFHVFLGFKFGQQTERTKAIIAIIASLFMIFFSSMILWTEVFNKTYDENDYLIFESKIAKCYIKTRNLRYKEDILHIKTADFHDVIKFSKPTFYDDILKACKTDELYRFKVYRKKTLLGVHAFGLVEMSSIQGNKYVFHPDFSKDKSSENLIFFIGAFIVSIAVLVGCTYSLANRAKKETLKETCINKKEHERKDDEVSIRFHSDKNNTLGKIDEQQSNSRYSDYQTFHERNDLSNFKKKKQQYNRSKSEKINSDLIPGQAGPTNQEDQKLINNNLLNRESLNQSNTGKEKIQSIAEMTDELREFRLKLEKEGVIEKATEQKKTFNKPE